MANGNGNGNGNAWSRALEGERRWAGRIFDRLTDMGYAAFVCEACGMERCETLSAAYLCRGCAAIVLLSGLHGALRNALTDLRFAWQQRQASGDIVVVAIDAPRSSELASGPGRVGCTADLLRRLNGAGVRDVAFDVDFSSPSDPASDRAFAEALESTAEAWCCRPSSNRARTERRSTSIVR